MVVIGDGTQFFILKNCVPSFFLFGDSLQFFDIGRKIVDCPQINQ